jgi:hypothetical protein
MIIVLSLQTKIGIKTNILYERVVDMWEGNTSSDKKQYSKKSVKEGMSMHSPSAADKLDNNPSGGFPPAPIAPMNAGGGNSQQPESYYIPEPQPANFMGSPFGASF